MYAIFVLDLPVGHDMAITTRLLDIIIPYGIEDPDLRFRRCPRCHRRNADWQYDQGFASIKCNECTYRTGWHSDNYYALREWNLHYRSPISELVDVLLDELGEMLPPWGPPG